MTNSNPTRRAAALLRHEIMPAKHLTDQLCAQAGRVFTSLAEASIEAGTPLAISHPAMIKMHATLGHLLQARSGFVDVHVEMKNRGRILLPEIGWGDDDDTSKTNPIDNGQPAASLPA